MVQDSLWQLQAPALSPLLLTYLTESGSLTERLMATGHQFGVTVLSQGIVTSHADETSLLDLPADSLLYARHVLLTLDNCPVVYARSICRAECAVWQPILDRGSRSLGLTLFGGLPQLQRDPLHYRTVQAEHPLFATASQISPADHYPARRCRFLLEQAPMVVCEVFLPDLERFIQ